MFWIPWYPFSARWWLPTVRRAEATRGDADNGKQPGPPTRPHETVAVSPFSAITFQLRPWVQGVKIGPLFNRFRQAMDLYDRREYDKAIKELTKINRLDPTFVPAYQGRAMPWRTTLVLLSNSFWHEITELGVR